MAQCKATANRTGRQCQKRAIKGATVCLSHGAAASQVRRAAAKQAALEQVRAMLGQGRDADPGRVLASAVTSAAALLEGARAAVCADDADADDLRNLAAAAETAAKLARLCGDAGLAERFAALSQVHGELVAALLKRVVQGADFTQNQQTALFASLARELRSDGFDLDRTTEGYSMLKLEGEIALVEAKLAEHEQVEEARRLMAAMPERLAGAISAGLAVVDLDDDDRERVAQAVEGFLALEAETAAQQRTAAREADAARSAQAFRSQKR